MIGHFFKINSPTVAIDRPGDGAKIIHIPAGAAIKVLSETTARNQLVQVDWEGRGVLMFARDLVERGQRVYDP